MIAVHSAPDDPVGQLADRACTIAVAGELDLALSRRLTAAVNGCQQQPPADLTLLMDEVSFIDAGGLGAIVTASNAQRRAGHGLAIRGLAPRLTRVFRIAGVGHLIDPDAPYSCGDAHPAAAS